MSWLSKKLRKARKWRKKKLGGVLAAIGTVAPPPINYIAKAGAAVHKMQAGNPAVSGLDKLDTAAKTYSRQEGAGSVGKKSVKVTFDDGSIVRGQV